MSGKSRPGEIEAMLASGRLAELAQGCYSMSDLAPKIGLTPNALELRIKRIRRHGRIFPTIEELRGGLVETIEKSDFSNREVKPAVQECASDFEDEPPTNPSRSKWPSLAEFDAQETTRDASIESMLGHDVVRKLTREDCPEGSLMLWASDVHIRIEHTEALKLMVECAEAFGVNRVIAGGDILDLNCLSMHPKESESVVQHSTILEEVESGRWLLNWMAKKPCHYILGNHEDRLKRFIDMNPALHGSPASNLGWLVDLPKSIEVLPQGSEIRLGNLSMVHLDAEFKRGDGGKYPAHRLLEMDPDHSTIGGHVHRFSTAWRTSRDENGINRTRRGWTMGHMSHEHKHRSYMKKRPNWQVGFGLIRVYWEDDRPRWSVYQIEVLFDRHNRPYFEFGGKVFR